MNFVFLERCGFETLLAVSLELMSLSIKFVFLSACTYVFYGASNYSGLVRQVSEFSNVSVSA